MNIGSKISRSIGNALIKSRDNNDKTEIKNYNSSGNCIEDSSAKFIIDGLSENLENLNFSHNKIGLLTIKVLCDRFRDNTLNNLSIINLYNNNLNDSAVHCLCNELVNH